jgi:hypothetical protein
MLKRALNPFDTQRSYRARKSAVADVVVAAVAAGGYELEDVPLLTTSAQVGELETGRHCGVSCGRLNVDLAGRPAPTTLPASGGAEPRGARLGVAGKAAVASSTASPLSAREGERWQGCGVAWLITLTVQWGQYCSHPHPLGGRGTWLQEGWACVLSLEEEVCSQGGLAAN